MKSRVLFLVCFTALPLIGISAAEQECDDAVCIASLSPKKPFAKPEPCGPPPQKEPEKPSCPPKVCEPFVPLEKCLPKKCITPPTIPDVSCGADVAFSVDFIWWKAFIRGLEYAVTGIVDRGPFAPFGTNVQRGTIANPDFKFEPGFKAGIRTSLGHDGWDLFANYTRLTGDNLVSSLEASAGKGGVATIDATVFGPRGTTGNFASASSSFSQNLNAVDLELGRRFFISRRLILRPYVGLKGAWVTDKLRCDFHYIPNTFTEDGVVYSVLNGSNRRIQNMKGVGIRSGINNDWLIWKNLGLYSNLACTLLWGDFRFQERDTTETTLLGSTTNYNTEENFQEVNPVFEIALGISWTMWAYENRYRFQFQAGWEEQVWVDFNQFFETEGSLSLHGLTAQASLTF